MTTPTFRPVGEVIADIAKADPALADEVRAALSAKRTRDDLADAEEYLRVLSRTDTSRLGRALAVLLVEYDAREGKVRAPARLRADRPDPGASVAGHRTTTEAEPPTG